MNRFSLSPGAILVLALIYFFGGFKNLAAIITAVSVHEAGHAAAISIFGGKVKTLRFNYSGLCMSGFGAYSSACEVIILLAGPAAGLALALVSSMLGNLTTNGFLLYTAGISLVLTVYNMLPALPLDGGRALLIIIRRFTEAKIAERIMQCMSITTALVLALIGIYSHNTQAGAAFLAASVCLLIAQI